MQRGMYSVIISLSCGISLHVLKMSLFNNLPLIWFSEHAGVCLWRCMMSCQLKMCTAQSAEAFLTCMCVCGASLCARKHPRTFQQQKSSTQCYQTEKGSWILDAAVWTAIFVRRRLSSSSFSFSFCHSCWQSLIALDKLMKSDTVCSPHLPQYMSVWVHTCLCLCLAVPSPRACQPVNTLMRR